MLKIIFAAINEQEENSVLRKLMMGLMLGAAIGWVLLRNRRQDRDNNWESHLPGSSDEIEITEAVLSEEAEEAEEDEKLAAAEKSAARPAAKQPKKDKLEAIKGIGPVFARRLQEAGISTYRELANTPAEKLRTIVKAKSWQAVEAEDWITQAKELS